MASWDGFGNNKPTKVENETIFAIGEAVSLIVSTARDATVKREKTI